MRLFGYAPERGAAAGDTMPFHHGGRWHLFFSQPPVGAWEYVERARVSTAYLRSDDLVRWEVMPDAFGPGEHGECDGDGIWTGSVIEQRRRVSLLLHGLQPAVGVAADDLQGHLERSPHLGEGPGQPADHPRPALVRDRRLARPLRLPRRRDRRVQDADLGAAEGRPAVSPRLRGGGRLGRSGPLGGRPAARVVDADALPGMPRALPARRLVVPGGEPLFRADADGLPRGAHARGAVGEPQARQPRRAPLLRREVGKRRRAAGELRLDPVPQAP